MVSGKIKSTNRKPKSRDNKAVILLSGGIDSSTVLAFANSAGHELYALSFDYKQRHFRELESAKHVAEAFDVKKHLIINFDLREIGGSALTSEIEVPKTVKRDLGLGDSSNNRSPIPNTSFQIPVTYVPARNTIFLSFALAWAETLKAENIFIGANAVDYSGYPDCRPEYLKAFEGMANLATKASVEGELRYKIKAPLISMKKSEIIKKGVELGLDYSLTWSCYDPQPLNPPLPPFTKGGRGGISSSSLIPCGMCESCRFRKIGFAEAGITDPLLSL